MIGGWELVLFFILLVVLSGTAFGIILATFIIKRAKRKAQEVAAQNQSTG